MPYTQPGLSAVSPDRTLTNMSVAYMQSRDDFIASRVFPVVRVGEMSARYVQFSRADFNRIEMEERAPGTESAGGSYTLSKEMYQCVVRALHLDVPDQIAANDFEITDVNMSATEYVSQQALLRREKQWATSYFAEGIWRFQVDGAAARAITDLLRDAGTDDTVVRWNDAASNPIEDIRLFKRIVQERTGRRPNILTLGRAVYDTLLDHPDIVGRINGGGNVNLPAIVQRQLLAALFELEEILVMDAIENTALEGADEASAFIGGKHALLSYRPATAGRYTPSAGYTFEWTGYLGSVQDGVEISRFRMEHLKSTRVEVESAFDHKVVSADLGVFINGAVA